MLLKLTYFCLDWSYRFLSLLDCWLLLALRLRHEQTFKSPWSSVQASQSCPRFLDVWHDYMMEQWQYSFMPRITTGMEINSPSIFDLVVVLQLSQILPKRWMAIWIAALATINVYKSRQTSEIYLDCWIGGWLINLY